MSQLIALTGATGFIGSTLARQLISEGLHVRALTRPTSHHPPKSGSHIDWITGDLNDLDSLKRLVRGAHAVIHCAGAVRGATQEQFDATNADGVERIVLAAAEQNPLPRFILLSSLAAREHQISPYASSKHKGEKRLAASAAAMPWVIVRPPAVYGPGDREMRPLFQWARRGITPRFGNSDARFSLIYVDDLAMALCAFARKLELQGQAYELHDGHPRGYNTDQVCDTVSELYQRHVFRLPVPKAVLQLAAGMNLAAAKMLGYAPMLTPGKVRELTHPDWTCDNRAIQKAIDWSPAVDLTEGIKRTLTWKT